MMSAGSSFLLKAVDRTMHTQSAKVAVDIAVDMQHEMTSIIINLHCVISSVGRMSHCGCEGRWFEPNMTPYNLAVGEFV